MSQILMHWKIWTIKHIIQEFADLILRGTESRQASAQEPRPVGAPKVWQTNLWQRSLPFVLYAWLCEAGLTMHTTIVKLWKPPLVKKVEKQAGHDRLALLGDAGRAPPPITTDINEHSDKSELQKWNKAKKKKKKDLTVKHSDLKEVGILYISNKKYSFSNGIKRQQGSRYTGQFRLCCRGCGWVSFFLTVDGLNSNSLRPFTSLWTEKK